jgi:hypothetical protein
MRNSCIQIFDLIFNQLSPQHSKYDSIYKVWCRDKAVILIVQDTKIGARMLNAEINAPDPLYLRADFFLLFLHGFTSAVTQAQENQSKFPCQ